METDYRVLFTTERSERHQRAALAVAPANLKINMLRSPDRETLSAALVDVDYWITERAGTVDAALLRAAPNLKLIQRVGSNAYDIDLETAQAAGIAVCYWPLRSVVSVAEHVVMQILALVKQVNHAQQAALNSGRIYGEARRTDENTFAYNWASLDTLDSLACKTVGIQGMGEIGMELARRLVPWDVRLLYHKRRRLPEHVERDLNLSYADTDELYAASDVLVNLLPYSDQTDMLLNADVFMAMPRGSYVVSAGSGSVIDEGALARAIEEGHLMGAALDTYEYEPIQPDNPLVKAINAGHNVLLTPHTAAGSSDLAQDERAQAYANILAHIKGEPLRYRLT